MRALCRPYWRAGWCGRDILHALDHRPSMFTPLPRELGMPDELISPRQLILGRLRAWRDEHGRVRPGYWTSRARPGATVDPAAAGSSARELVRQRHGRAGARLLRAGETRLSVERIIGHGRAVRTAQSSATSEVADRGSARAEQDQRRAQLVARARAETARLRPAVGAEQVWSPRRGSTPTTAYERALTRARSENARRTRREP